MAGKVPMNIRELNARASELVEQILDPATNAVQNRKLLKELEHIMMVAHRQQKAGRVKTKLRKLKAIDIGRNPEN
jgi:hypothetical protein